MIIRGCNERGLTSMGMERLEAASRRALVPPARAAPGAGCSAPDSARLHSRECYRPEDTKAGKHLRVEVQTTSCPQKPGRKLPDRSVCATLRDCPGFSRFYPPGLGSKQKAQSRGNSGACAAGSLPPGDDSNAHHQSSRGLAGAAIAQRTYWSLR